MMKDILISSFRFVGIIIVSYLLIRGFSDMAISALSTSATPLSMYTSTGLPMSAVPVQTKATPTSTITLSDIGNALSSGSPLSVAQLIYLSQQYPNALSTNQPFSLSDTASAVQSNLAALDQLYSNGVIGSISLTDSSAPQFSMSPSDFTNSSGLLSTINSAFAVQVNQPFSVAQALSLPPNLANKFLPLDIEDSAQNILSNNAQLTQSTSSIKYIVSDTAQNISNNFGSLSSLQSIQSFNILQDPNVSSQNQNLLTITDAQLNSNANLISKLPTNYLLNITNATAADATTLQKNPHVENIQISDTAKNISNNISNINSITKHMTVNVTDTAQNISLYSAQLNQLKAIYNTTITSSVSDIIAQSNNLNHLKSTFSINMSSSDLLNNLDSLEGLTKLNSINLTDNPPITNITLTADQYSKDKAVISKVAPPISVNLTNVPVSNLKTLAQDSNVQSISIVDNIGAMNSDAINTINSLSNLSSYTYFNSNRIQPISINSLTINVNNTTSNNNISQLATLKIPYNSTGSLPNFTINAQGILNYSSSGTISASAQSTLSAINQLNKGLDGNINLGQAIIQSGSNPPIPFTPTSPITSSQNTQIINLIPPLTGQYTVSMPQIGGGFVSRTVTLPPNSELQDLVNALSIAFANDNQDNVKFTSDNNSLQINYQNNGPTFWPKNLSMSDTAANLSKYSACVHAVIQNGSSTPVAFNNSSPGNPLSQSLSLSPQAGTYTVSLPQIDGGSISKTITISSNPDGSPPSMLALTDALNKAFATDGQDKVVFSGTGKYLQLNYQNSTGGAYYLTNTNVNFNVTDGINAAINNSQGLSALPDQYSIIDTAKNISNNYNWISTTINLSGVNISDPSNPITITSKDLLNSVIPSSSLTTVAKILNPNYKVVITNSPSAPLTCADAQSLNSSTSAQILSMPIVDSSANVNNLLQPLNGASSLALNWNNITSITLNDATASNPQVITLTAQNYLADQNLLNKINSPYNLNITNASVAEVTNPTNPSYILSNSKITSATVSDTSTNVAANLIALAPLISQHKVSLASLSDPSSPTTITLTPAQIESSQIQSAINAFTNLNKNLTINVTPMHISDITAVDTLKNKFNITSPYSIIDTAANISNFINSNPTSLNEISKLTVSDSSNPLTLSNSALMNNDKTTANTNLISFLNNTLSGPYNMQFTGLTFQNMEALVSSLNSTNSSLLPHISGYTISDTANNISTEINNPQSVLYTQNLSSKVKSITIPSASNTGKDASNTISLSSFTNPNFNYQNIFSLLKNISNQFYITLPSNASMVTALINTGIIPNLKGITLPLGSSGNTAYNNAYNSLIKLLGASSISH